MALAINIMHGHGPSNEMRCQLQLKKTKVRLRMLAVNICRSGARWLQNMPGFLKPI